MSVLGYELMQKMDWCQRMIRVSEDEYEVIHLSGVLLHLVKFMERKCQQLKPDAKEKRICPFCHEIPTNCSLELHVSCEHRYNMDNGRFICGYCPLWNFKNWIFQDQLTTHGTETCVLCLAQFQHFGFHERGMAKQSEKMYGGSSWGVMFPVDQKQMENDQVRQRLATIGHSVGPAARVAMLLDLVGECRGLYYSPVYLPPGAVCPKCITYDRRLVHVWSH
jgi:hypothetical protein